MEDLLERYKLDAGIAFDIARPRLRAALREYDEREAAEIASSRKKQGLLAKLAREKEKVGEPTAAPASTNGTAPEEDVKMEEAKPVNEAGTPPPASDDKAVVEAEDLVPTAGDADPASAEEAMEAAASPALPLSVSISRFSSFLVCRLADLESEQPWHPGLIAPISRVEQLLPAEARDSIGYAATFVLSGRSMRTQKIDLSHAGPASLSPSGNSRSTTLCIRKNDMTPRSIDSSCSSGKPVRCPWPRPMTVASLSTR